MGVCVFRCNLSSALFAEWPWSFTCHSSDTGEERTPNVNSGEKIIPPLLPGFELATFRTRVRRSYKQASPNLNLKHYCPKVPIAVKSSSTLWKMIEAAGRKAVESEISFLCVRNFDDNVQPRWWTVGLIDHRCKIRSVAPPIGEQDTPSRVSLPCRLKLDLGATGDTISSEWQIHLEWPPSTSASNVVLALGVQELSPLGKLERGTDDEELWFLISSVSFWARPCIVSRFLILRFPNRIIVSRRWYHLRNGAVRLADSRVRSGSKTSCLQQRCLKLVSVLQRVSSCSISPLHTLHSPPPNPGDLSWTSCWPLWKQASEHTAGDGQQIVDSIKRGKKRGGIKKKKKVAR